MIGRRLALIMGFVVVAASPAAAEDAGGFYVGVRGTGSLAELDSVNANGFAGSSNVQNDSDSNIGIGAVVGYRWQDIPLRTEIEGGYRFRFDFDAQDSGPPVTDYEVNIATTTVLLNALLEWRNDTEFTPFVGGSVGWARHSSDTSRVVIPTQAETSKTTDKDNLAWGVMAGVGWEFLDHWSAELAYRYTDLGEVDAGSFSGGDSLSADDYISHDLLLTVSYRF